MPSFRETDVLISDRAGAQFHVISTKQLRELGVTRASVHRREKSGMLRRILPTVHAVGPAGVDPGPAGWRMAAVLACSGPSALCGETAADRLGVWDRGDGTIHVVSRHGHRPAQPRHVRFHRCRALSTDDIVIVDRIPTTCLERTIFDLARILTPWQLCAVFREAVFLGLFDVGRLHEYLARHPRAPGMVTAMRAISLFEQGCAGTRSWTEDVLLDGVLTAGIPEPWVCNPNSVDLAGIEPDLAWPEAMLVVEVDGGGHGAPARRARDHTQDATLRGAGWHVLRVPGDEARRRRVRVVDRIRRLYEQRMRLRRRSSRSPQRSTTE